MKISSRKCAMFTKDIWDSYQINRCLKKRWQAVYDLKKTFLAEDNNLADEYKKSVDAFYLKHYGETVDYTWHELCFRLTGEFDIRYFPSPLYFAEFERFENINQAFTDVLTDKNFIPIVAKGFGISMPKMLLNCTCGVYRNAKNEFIDRTEVEKYLNSCGEVVIKPSVDSWGGTDVKLVCFKQGVDQYSGETIETILKKYGDDFVVQERLRSHESLRKIYPESINNFRVVSYRWRDEIRICPAFLRIGHGGSFVDNICSGGFSVGIDDDGVLVGAALFEEMGAHIDRHPDTGLKFEGYVLPGFVKILNAVRRLHENIPQVGCCNWDFTLSEEEEPVLIEANVMNGGGCDSSQLSHGKAFFGEHTAEILRWLRVVKKTPMSKRKQYMFGYGVD